MKLQSSTLNLVSAGITIAALSLALHTAHQRGKGTPPRVVIEGSDERSRSISDMPASAEESVATAGHDQGIIDSVRNMLAIDYSLDRTRALLALMSELSTADLHIALNACPRSEMVPRGPVFDILFDELIRRDPMSALDYADSTDKALKLRVLGSMLDSDPDAALRLAQDHVTRDPGSPLFTDLLVSLADRGSPDMALKNLGSLDPQARQKTLADISRRSDATTFDALGQWMESLEDPAERIAAAETIFLNWNHNLPPEHKLALLEIAPEALGKTDVSRTFADWVKLDPVAARAAADRLTSGESRRKAVSAMMTTALFSDSDDLSSGMMNAYPDEVDDRLIASCLQSSSLTDRQLALQRASLIKDPALRDETRAEVLRDWEETDPGEARKWIAENEPGGLVLEMFEQRAAKPTGDDLDDSRLLEAIGR